MAPAIILDVDGTLVDSNDAHAHAWVEALAEQGERVPLERVRPLIGMGGDKVVPALLGLPSESPRGRDLSERRGRIFRERYLPHLRPFPAVPALLERMQACGLQLVVASSSNAEEVQSLLEIAGAAGLVGERTSVDDARHSTPDPDIVRAALEASGRAPAEVLLLGDTPYDVAAAARAGIGTVALRCGGWSYTDLAGAVSIYDDPADLLSHYDDSPFACS